MKLEYIIVIWINICKIFLDTAAAPDIIYQKRPELRNDTLETIHCDVFCERSLFWYRYGISSLFKTLFKITYNTLSIK